MKNEAVQALNYCTHAIEGLRKSAAELSQAAPLSATALLRTINLLKAAVKFILPNCGGSLEPDGLRQAHLDSMRLPFPVVAFEMPWWQEDAPPEQIGGFPRSTAPKRIALCWEPDPARDPIPGMSGVLDSFPGGGAFVLPIFWDLHRREWMPALGGVFVPYENVLGILEPDKWALADRLAHDAGLLGPKAKCLQAEPFVLLPEVFESLAETHGGRDTVTAQILLDSGDEIRTMIQACSVVNCANITSVQVRASEALNRKRHAKGQQPFFDYKVLQVAGERRVHSRSRLGGAHASPRMHLRRGHIRRLDGRPIWIRATTVNAGSKLGLVLKDYAVSDPRFDQAVKRGGR